MKNVSRVLLLLGLLITLPLEGQFYTSITSGQQAVTATAAALPSKTSHNVCVKGLVGNSINVYLGPSTVTTSNGMELAPGDVVCLPVANPSAIYVIASTTGASVSWIAVN
jgi:hypothetical protein